MLFLFFNGSIYGLYWSLLDSGLKNAELCR